MGLAARRHTRPQHHMQTEAVEHHICDPNHLAPSILHLIRREGAVRGDRHGALKVFLQNITPLGDVSFHRTAVLKPCFQHSFAMCGLTFNIKDNDIANEVQNNKVKTI